MHESTFDPKDNKVIWGVFVTLVLKLSAQLQLVKQIVLFLLLLSVVGCES